LNGGLPFGSGFSSWIEKSPEFNLDRVTAPVRLEGYNAGSVLGLWDWFTGLSLLEKPVDLEVDSSNVVVSPSANGVHGVSWLEEFLRKGGGSYVDIIAYHLYVSHFPRKQWSH
jgi:hypothetical protein